MLTMVELPGLTCPAFVCETCHEPVYASDGLVVWTRSRDDSGQLQVSELWTVHQGRCDQAWEAKVGQHLMSRELDQFMRQLMHNTENPFPPEYEVALRSPV